MRKKTLQDNWWLLSALVVLLAGILTVNALYLLSRLEKEGRYNTRYELTSRQTARTAELTASIKDVGENDTFDPAFTLEEGETMLIMSFSITNNTKNTQDFIPTSQLYVRTRLGDYRPMHPSMQITKHIVAGKIKPGETIAGQISFGVPKSATNPLLFIDTGWNSAAPVVFNVLK